MSSSDEGQTSFTATKLKLDVLKCSATTEEFLRWRASLATALACTKEQLNQELLPVRPSNQDELIPGVEYRKPVKANEKDRLQGGDSLTYISNTSKRAITLNAMMSALDKEIILNLPNPSPEKENEPLRIIAALDQRFGIVSPHDLATFNDKFHSLKQSQQQTASDFIARLDFYATELIKRGYPLTRGQMIISRFLSGAHDTGEYPAAKRAIMNVYHHVVDYSNTEEFDKIIHKHFNMEKATVRARDEKAKPQPQSNRASVPALAAAPESSSYGKAQKGKKGKGKLHRQPYPTPSPAVGSTNNSSQSSNGGHSFCSKCGMYLYSLGSPHVCRQVITCSFCKKVGHAEANCRSKQKQSSSSSSQN